MDKTTLLNRDLIMIILRQLASLFGNSIFFNHNFGTDYGICLERHCRGGFKRKAKSQAQPLAFCCVGIVFFAHCAGFFLAKTKP